MSGTSWGRPANPGVSNEVPNNLGKFPRDPQVPGTQERQVRRFFLGGDGSPCNIAKKVSLAILKLNINYKIVLFSLTESYSHFYSSMF